MNREIKFRGKAEKVYGSSIKEGEWAYGSLIQNEDACFIADKMEYSFLGYCSDCGRPYCDDYKVYPETVGQYTGLKDKNGTEIYEGDILRFPPKDEYEKTNYCCYEVFFHDNDCCDNHIGWQMNRLHFQGSLCGGSFGLDKFKPSTVSNMIIIGNIYENKDLLSPYIAEVENNR